jgi:hypothetical protein
MYIVPKFLEDFNLYVMNEPIVIGLIQNIAILMAFAMFMRIFGLEMTTPEV